MYRYLFSVIFLAQIVNLSAQHIPVKYEQFTVKSGLLSQTVYNAIEDKEGFLWVCTNLGLSKFDGYHFVNCRTNENSKENETLDLIEDSKGRIWVIPFYGNLSYWQNNKYYSVNNTAFLRNLNTGLGGVRIVESTTGSLYILPSNRKNIVIEIDKNDKISEKDFTPFLNGKEELISIYLSKQGKLLVMVSNGKILEWDKPEKVYSNKKFNEERTVLPVGSHDNSVFFIDKYGLNEITDTNSSCLIPYHCLRDVKLFQCVRKDKSGNIWVTHATLNTMLYIKTNYGYSSEPINMLKGIPASVCFDQHHNTWLCSSTDGLIRIPKVALDEKSLKANQLIMEENILSSYCQKEGTYWLGYSNGYVTRVSKGKATNINVNQGTRSYNRVLDIAEDGIGDIYVVTDEGGLRIKKSSGYNIVEYLAVNDRKTTPGKGLFYDNNGNIIFSFGYSIGTFSNLKTKTIPDNEVVTIRQFSHFISKNNDLYFSTSEGLKVLRNNKLINLSLKDKRLNARINYFSESQDGTIILSTYSDGIMAIKNDVITSTLTVDEGLAGLVCTKILNHNDTFYVATNNGISMFSCLNSKLKLIRNIISLDGLVSNFINSLFIYRNDLYACTPKGLSVVSLSSLSYVKAAPPRLSVLSFTVNGKNYSLDSTHEFKFSNYHFQISFVSQNLGHGTEVTYRYRIRENQTNWIQTKFNIIDLSNLRPGSYHIEIQSKFINSDWCEPKVVSFIIKPPFYATWWFILIVFIILWCALFLTVKFIVNRKYELRLQELNMKQALENERSRIASDLHDDIGAEVTNIMLLSQLSKSPDKPDYLVEKLEKSATELINKVNEVVWALNVQNDTLRNLVSYVHDFAKQLFENTDIKLKFDSDVINIDDRMVSASFRRNIFLVIKECLNNIIKHSGASLTEIKAIMEGEIICFSISDNGIGFSDQQKKQKWGNGLKNMRTRIAQVGGTIEIDSKPNRGTHILLKIKLGK